jgi:hypothetical protein
MRSTANRGSGGFKADGSAAPSGLVDEPAGPSTGGAARFCPFCLMKRSMAGETEEGGKEVWFRLPCVVAGWRVGDGAGVGNASGKVPGAEFVPAAVGKAGVWATHGAGATQGSDNAMISVNGQAALPFMAGPPRSTVSSVR